MSKPELSIIIVSFNTKQVTGNCLDSIFNSLKKSALDYEVIVVDNGSTDSSVEMLKRYERLNVNTLKLILNKKNTGFGKANNQAVRQAQGKYILFLNSDIVTLDNAIVELLRCYQENETKIHFLGGKLLEKDGITPQPSAGPFYSLPVIFAALFLRGDYWSLTRYSPNKLQRVSWVSGACILTKKEFFNKVGGFDEEIFLYMEEIDLLYRAYLKNLHTFFYPQARFIHIGFASSGGRSSPIINVYRGFLYLYKKHFSARSLFFLKLLLKLKALIAILIGRLTKNRYLYQTYEKALALTKMDR